jgi:endonuclease YncB( thermonuclease family)
MTVGWSWPDSRLVAVVDGDTIDVHVARDLGFGGTAAFTVRLRLNRINCPPAHTTQGKAATAFVVAALPIAGAYLLETLKPYKYGGPDTSPGEWMAEVTLTDGSNLSDSLVSAGLAVYWDGEGPRPGG